MALPFSLNFIYVYLTIKLQIFMRIYILGKNRISIENYFTLPDIVRNAITLDLNVLRNFLRLLNSVQFFNKCKKIHTLLMIHCYYSQVLRT